VVSLGPAKGPHASGIPHLAVATATTRCVGHHDAVADLHTRDARTDLFDDADTCMWEGCERFRLDACGHTKADTFHQRCPGDVPSCPSTMGAGEGMCWSRTACGNNNGHGFIGNTVANDRASR
jgi:hypothetical protein